jgi:hypothetical protein
LRRRILLASVVLLFVAMLATPIVGTSMAKSPNKVPVQAFITGINYVGDVETRITDDGILHIEHLRMEGTIMIIVNGDDANPILVDWIDDPCDGVYNPTTDKSTLRFDEVWSIEGMPAFAGTDHIIMDGNILDTYTGLRTHMILQGVGHYKGQVLSLKMDFNVDDPDPDGFLGTWLKP